MDTLRDFFHPYRNGYGYAIAKAGEFTLKANGGE